MGSRGVDADGFIASLALALVGTVTVGATQVAKPARVVVLSRSPANVQGLHDVLQELGHVEGRTYTIELRHAGGSTVRLQELATEVARSMPDIIYTPHGVAATAAKAATSSIPIVFFFVESRRSLPAEPGVAVPGCQFGSNCGAWK